MQNIKKFKVNFSVYIFLILVIFSGFKRELPFILFVFIIHELGHIFFCILFKVEIVSIEIFPYGGMLHLNKLLNISIVKDLFISGGGLLFQIFLQLLNVIFFKNLSITFYNLYFLIFNALPVIPLDGSKLFFNLISIYISYYKSLVITEVVSFISILAFILYFFIIDEINIMFLCFVITFTIKELLNIKHVYRRFLIERWLYNFHFKHNKYYKRCNLRFLKRETMCFFFNGDWKNEKFFLNKKFDNSSYIW